MIPVPDDDVIEDFDFKKLARPNEVTGDFNVRLGWSRPAIRCRGSPAHCHFSSPEAKFNATITPLVAPPSCAMQRPSSTRGNWRYKMTAMRLERFPFAK